MKLKKLIMAAIFVIIIPGSLTAQETVRLTNGEWPPFNSEKLSGYGLAFMQENAARAVAVISDVSGIIDTFNGSSETTAFTPGK